MTEIRSNSCTKKPAALQNFRFCRCWVPTNSRCSCFGGYFIEYCVLLFGRVFILISFYCFNCLIYCCLLKYMLRYGVRVCACVLSTVRARLVIFVEHSRLFSLFGPPRARSYVCRHYLISFHFEFSSNCTRIVCLVIYH